MTTRRSFMAGILAAATPPGFVRAGVLMPVAPLIVRPLDLFSVLGGPPYMGDGDAADPEWRTYQLEWVEVMRPREPRPMPINLVWSRA